MCFLSGFDEFGFRVLVFFRVVCWIRIRRWVVNHWVNRIVRFKTGFDFCLDWVVNAEFVVDCLYFFTFVFDPNGAPVYEATFIPEDTSVFDHAGPNDVFVALQMTHDAVQPHLFNNLVIDTMRNKRCRHTDILAIKHMFDCDGRACVVMPLNEVQSLRYIIASTPIFRQGFPEDCIAVALRETIYCISTVLTKNLPLVKFSFILMIIVLNWHMEGRVLIEMLRWKPHWHQHLGNCQFGLVTNGVQRLKFMTLVMIQRRISTRVTFNFCTGVGLWWVRVR